METLCYLLITNKLKTCTISIPDPFSKNSTIDLRINKKKNSKINLEFINGTPYISIEVFLEGFGLSLDSDTNYDSSKDVKTMNEYTEEYMKVQLENYLYKTSKEFKSDISGFGKYAISKYLTLDEWLDSNWLENYKNAFFNVKVNMNVNSGYEFNKSP